MAEFPALPLFTDALLADCGHLSDAELGIYIKVLMFMWRTSGCRLPADNEWLARKFQRSVEDFEKQVKPLMQEFCECDGNWWTQGRLSDEREWVKNNSKRQSVRSKARWNKENKPSRGNAALHRSGNAPNPTPPTNIYSSEFDIFWKSYPRRVGRGHARKAYESAVKKASPDIILQRAKLFASQCAGKESKFIPHPATWLNGERWEDDLQLSIISTPKAGLKTI